MPKAIKYECVGALLYNELGQCLFIQNEKWVDSEGNMYWIVPGGKRGFAETEEEALRREIDEETGYEITDILEIQRKEKPPSADFHEPHARFLFIDYIARVLPGQFLPNNEVVNHRWMTLDEALGEYLLDSTRNLVQKVRLQTSNPYQKPYQNHHMGLQNVLQFPKS